MEPNGGGCWKECVVLAAPLVGSCRTCILEKEEPGEMQGCQKRDEKKGNR